MVGYGLGLEEIRNLFFKMLTISEGIELPITNVAEANQEGHIGSFDVC